MTAATSVESEAIMLMTAGAVVGAAAAADETVAQGRDPGQGHTSEAADATTAAAGADHLANELICPSMTESGEITLSAVRCDQITHQRALHHTVCY